LGTHSFINYRISIMRLNDFYKQLTDLGLPSFKTEDIAIYCNITNAHASQLLLRLAMTDQVLKIKRGLWVLPDKIDKLALPYFLTMPFPSYISLQSALYYHDIIMQIPEILYAVSIARTKIYETPISTVSIHHIAPEMMLGYEEVSTYIYIAKKEKALIDFLYFSQAKSRVFAKLPEVDIPENFDTSLAKLFANKIPYKNRRQRVLNLLNDIFK